MRHEYSQLLERFLEKESFSFLHLTMEDIRGLGLIVLGYLIINIFFKRHRTNLH